jgi:hypothetical protein
MNNLLLTHYGDRIKKFAIKTSQSYKQRSIVNSDNSTFEPIILKEIPENKEFIQFANRLLFHFSFFADNIDNSMIASEYGKSIALSEKQFLVEEMKKSQDEKDIGKMGEITYKNFLKKIKELDFVPTDIFIPRKFFQEVYRFYGKDRLEKENGVLYLKAYGDIRVHFSSVTFEFNKIFFLDAKSVVWLQKISKQMKVSNYPDYLESILSEDDIFQVLAGRRDTDSIDFLLRTIASVEIDRNKVKILETLS